LINYSWICLLQIVPAQKKIALATAIVKNACGIIRKRTSGPTVQGNHMAKELDIETRKKREKIQLHLWNIVGAVEHISLPKLVDAVKKEFNCNDDRFVQAQIRLMQSEARIKVQSNVKVWIKQPPT
jgi:hypothetical protein